MLWNRYTRIRWTVVVIAVLAVASVAHPVSAEPSAVSPDSVVYPTGAYPTDIDNVQAAVDAGGVVLLKSVTEAGEPSAFNFGTADVRFGPRVNVTTNVEIHGETENGNQTRISGGWMAFFATQSTTTVVSGIHFDGQGVSAMIYVASAGAEFSNNRITNVVGSYLPFLDATEGRGVKFLGNNDPEGAFTGRIVIRDNVFEHMHADLSSAVVFDFVGADVEVIGNTIRDIGGDGILALNGSGGHTTIAANDIAPGPGISSWSFGAGMFIYGGSTSYTITDNRITTENPLADGMLLVGDSDAGAIVAPVISKNHIEMKSSFFGAISLLGDVTGASVTSNRILGSGDLGINLIFDWWADTAPSNNTFVGNNLATFDAETAHVYFDDGSSGNVLAGNKATVIDLGEANTITGRILDGDASIGERISAAQRLRQRHIHNN